MKWPDDNAAANLPNVCRLCMAESTEFMQRIFAECEHDGERFLLSSRITAVTSLKVEPGDQLPEQACDDCVAQVNRWYEFKMMCKNSDFILHQRLLQTNSDIEILMQLRIKEESSEVMPTTPELADSLTHASPFLSSDSSIRGLTDYSTGEENGTLGRISTTFSLRQESSSVGALQSGLLFSGDPYAVNNQPVESITNGFSTPLPFLCTLCDARFSRKSHLKQHIAAHCGEPPHQCLRCDAGFSLKTQLMEHIHEFHPPPRIVRQIIPPKLTCVLCPSKFKTIQNLVLHQTSHTSVFRWQCIFCRRVCTNALNLSFHLYSHVKHGKTCSKCRRTFSSIRLFRQHYCFMEEESSHLQS